MIESKAPAWTLFGCTEPVALSKTGVTNETLETSTESDAKATPHTKVL